MTKEKKEINFMAISIMLLGILISVISTITNSDLMFVGGTLFGIGLGEFL
jgi:hypothetical protein